MAAKSKAKQATVWSSSVIYYVMRAAHRVTLLLAALSTFALFATIISLPVNTAFDQEQGEVEYSVQFQHDLTATLDSLMRIAIMWAIVAVGVSLLLWLMPRVRQHEKRLVFDGLVIAIFFGTTAVLAQAIVRSFLAGVIG